MAKFQKVFHFGSNIPKYVPNQYPEHYPPTYREDAQGGDLAPFLENLSQSKNLSEIKPPLVPSVAKLVKPD